MDNHKKVIYNNLLDENVEQVNKLLGIILWGFAVILMLYGIVAKLNIVRVSEKFILIWAGFVLILNVINGIMIKLKVPSKVRKYYCICAMEIAIIFGGLDVRIGYHILYVLVPVASCIYLDKKLTFVASVLSLIAMNLCIIYVSADRVANVNTNYTRMGYIKSHCIGYSVEFVSLMLVLWMLTTRIVQVMTNLAEKI